MIPAKLKALIDEYCTGVKPSDEQNDLIMDMIDELNADYDEATKYMNKKIAGPTKAEIQRRAEARAAKKSQEEAEHRRIEAKRRKEAAMRRAEEAQEKKYKRSNTLGNIFLWLSFVVFLCLGAYAMGFTDVNLLNTQGVVIGTAMFCMTLIISAIHADQYYKLKLVAVLCPLSLVIPALIAFSIITLPALWAVIVECLLALIGIFLSGSL